MIGHRLRSVKKRNAGEKPVRNCPGRSPDALDERHRRLIKEV